MTPIILGPKYKSYTQRFYPIVCVNTTEEWCGAERLRSKLDRNYNNYQKKRCLNGVIAFKLANLYEVRDIESQRWVFFLAQQAFFKQWAGLQTGQQDREIV